MSDFLRLTDEQTKLLGRSSIRLFAFLRQRHGRRPLDIGLRYDLSWLAGQLDKSYMTIRRSVDRLRECGAIRTERVVVGRQQRQLRIFMMGHLVYGKPKVPKQPFLAWAEGRRPRGRPVGSGGSYTPRRANKGEHSHVNVECSYFFTWDPDLPNDAQGLANKYERANSDYTTYSLSPSSKEEREKNPAGAGRILIPPPTLSDSERLHLERCMSRSRKKRKKGFDENGMPIWPDWVTPEEQAVLNQTFENPLPPPLPGATEDEKLRYAFARIESGSDAARQLAADYFRKNPTPAEQGHPPPRLPPLDVPTRVVEGYESIPEHFTPERRVKAIFRGWAEAVEAVYGKAPYLGWLRKGKDICEVKGYSRLVKAAEVLIEKGIPPGAWAHWKLAWLKKAGKANKAWGVVRLFIASTISKQSGWWRNDFEHISHVRENWTDAHTEQLLRQQEAVSRWRQKRRHHLMGFPSWYSEKRREEIAQGFVDPLTCYERVRD